MNKVGGHRNYGYGKRMGWAGKNALKDTATVIMQPARHTSSGGGSLWPLPGKRQTYATPAT
jgi:hypothetical protein